MLILWIRKSKNSMQDEDLAVEKHSFSNHNEDMKRFKQLHQELQTVVNKDIMTTDGAILAPIHGVRLAKNSQN